MEFRCRASVPYKLSLADESEAGAVDPQAILSGQTCNLSVTGVALILPSLSIGERTLTADDCRLELTLGLPTGPIRMQVAAVHHQELSASAAAPTYLLGVRIVDMSDEDCLYFVKYLRTLH